MLLPAQRAAGTATINLMQSMLDSVEKRRAEDEEKTKGKKEDPILKAKMSADTAMQRAQEKISAYLFDPSYTSINELKLQVMDRVGKVIGVSKEDNESGYSYGKKLEDAIKDMDYATQRQIEKDSGLADLGISLKTMIAAIKNPYGDDGQTLNAALEKATGGGKDNNVSQSKALQRLEDIAHPKTAEELKLEEGSNDPTRVEDDETRAERQQDISDKQAMDKLDDVRDVQKAIKDNNEQVADAANDGDTGSATDGANAESLKLIQVLAASADAAQSQPDQSDTPAESADGTDDADPASAPDPAKAADAATDVAPADPADELKDEKEKPILTVHVDELGIYDLLKQKKVA